MTRACYTRGLLLAAIFAGLVPSVRAASGGSAAAPRTPERISKLIMADLDGDSHADVAISSSTRKDGIYYTQEISFRFSGSEDSAIRVRTMLRAERLTVRDLDGDANRDLILESFTREPLAVLLNDGHGHFHQEDIENFRSELAQKNSQSIEPVQPGSSGAETGECPNYQPAAGRLSSHPPDLPCARLIACFRTTGLNELSSGSESRGPPSHF
ncbi:MAG TPA: hypothetical protein VL285_10240 [Bryobacteraceae bacterium]|jgi:hypothetical protein|nr:hypothetical protein [Bryobacteraceae bacterium]